MKFKLHSPLYIHEIGNRPNQEDALYPINASINNRVFILCDGMGGHQNGEVASQTVCQELGEWLTLHTKTDEPFTDEQLFDALEYTYSKLDEHYVEGGKQMGTTLTLLYFHRQGVTIAYIGDSRIYHIRPHEGILFQSRDHSLAFDLFLTEEITYDEIATFPQKNVITRAMTPGKENRRKADIVHITDIKPNDWFYLCSDGMLEQMSGEELASILSATDVTDEEKREILIEATANNKDNHTAWLLHVAEVINETGDETLFNEEMTSNNNVIYIKSKEQIVEAVPIEEESDVVMVSVPTSNKVKPKKIRTASTSFFYKFRVWAFRLITCLLLVVLCLALFWALRTFVFTDNEDTSQTTNKTEKVQKKKKIMVKKRATRKSTEKEEPITQLDKEDDDEKDY